MTMCGIAGTVHAPGFIHERAVERMTAALRHRGPEGTSYACLGDAQFGFCRLAFVDIGYTSQPLVTLSGKFLITFNGEIYNHRELRRLTPPDTARGEVAVLAALYEKYGAEFTSRLNGMYAIAIYDHERRELLLFRDRAGEKPLYYFCSR